MRARPFVVASSLALLAGVFLAAPGQTRPEAAYGVDDIPGRYIVVFEDGVEGSAGATVLEANVGVDADVIYDTAIDGFAAEMTADQAAQIAKSGLVAAVVPDRQVYISIHENPFQTLPTGVNRIDADVSPTASISSGGPNLNIDVAVIDTGVTAGHVDLNVAGGAQLPCTGNTFADGHGHGTHVAGTIAAIDDNHGVAGVAPGARIWGVKVLDDSGNGTTSCVIDGVDWVASRRLEYNDGAGDGDAGINIAAANLSLGGLADAPPGVDPLCLAINSAVQAGVMVAVAAGNDSADSSAYSPAQCPSAVTVSAFADFDGQEGALSGGSATFTSCPGSSKTVTDDKFACFSNFGVPVDIAAPGVDIISTYPGPGGTCAIVSCYATMSGTSMATPHVAGAYLLLKMEGYNGLTDGAAVMAAFMAAGYTRSQNSACGFTGDYPGDPAEPVLYIGPDCPDQDHDSVPNAIDNCPTVANTSQANQDGDEYGDACEQPQCISVINHWTTSPGDSDCDGYADTQAVAPRAAESFVGTNSASKCSATPAIGDEALPDTWPPDFNDNQLVNGADWLSFTPHMLSEDPDPEYSKRWDLNGNGIINGADMLQLIPFFTKFCSP